MLEQRGDEESSCRPFLEALKSLARTRTEKIEVRVVFDLGLDLVNILKSADILHAGRHEDGRQTTGDDREADPERAGRKADCLCRSLPVRDHPGGHTQHRVPQQVGSLPLQSAEVHYWYCIR